MRLVNADILLERLGVFTNGFTDAPLDDGMIGMEAGIDMAIEIIEEVVEDQIEAANERDEIPCRICGCNEFCAGKPELYGLGGIWIK